MRQMIVMRLCRRLSTCHRPHQPALHHVRRGIIVRERHCIMPTQVDVRAVVLVNIVRKDRMRRLTVKELVRVAMAPVRVRRVLIRALRAAIQQVAQQDARFVLTSRSIRCILMRQGIHLLTAHGLVTKVITRHLIISVDNCVAGVLRNCI